MQSLQQMLGDFQAFSRLVMGTGFLPEYDKPPLILICWLIFNTSKHHSSSFTFAYQTGRPVSSPVVCGNR